MLLEIDDDDAAVLFSVLPGLLRPSDASQWQQIALARVRRRIAETVQQMNLQWVRLDEDVEMGVDIGSTSLSEDLGERGQTRAVEALSLSSTRATTGNLSSERATRIPPKLTRANVPVTSEDTPQAGHYKAAASPSATPPAPSPGAPSLSPATFSSPTAWLIHPLPRRNLRELTNTPGRDKENFNREKDTDCPSLPVSPFRLPAAPPLPSSPNSPDIQDVFGANASLGPPIQLLSPLYIPHALSPTPLSPSITIIGSESPEKNDECGASKKRSQDTLGLTGGNGRAKRLCCAREMEQALAAPAEGGVNDPDDCGAEEYDQEDYVVEARARRGARGRVKSPCPCGANRTRANAGSAQSAARTIADVQRLLENEMQGDMTEEQETGWNTNGKPPPLSASTSASIVRLSYVTTSPEIQNKLIDLLRTLLPIGSAPTSSSPSSNPLPTDSCAPFARRCAALENAAVMNDFHQMVSYMELALHIQWRKQQPTGGKVGFRELAAECNNSKITECTMSKWNAAGTRLIYLAGACLLYIIPMLAAAGMKDMICFKCTVRQIISIAFALCCPPEPDATFTLTSSCGQLIRTVIAPQMALIAQISNTLNTQKFCLFFPGKDPRVLSFRNVEGTMSKLRTFDVKYFHLPNPDPVWQVLKSATQSVTLAVIPPLSPFSIDSSCIADEIKIVSPLDLQKTPNPVTRENLESFTESERAKAVNAKEVESVAGLQEAINNLHASGVRKPDSYLLIDTKKVCEGKVLHLRDKNNKLLALVATNLLELLPHLETTIMHQLASIMAGEIHTDNSNRIGYSFLAWHCSYYSHYAEKGHGAPKNVHPYYVQKDNATHVNHTQWAPYLSQEVENNPEESDLLAEMIHLITIITEYHVQHFMPEEHAEIEIFVTKLPLNERSLAYPFRGFVINVSVSTRAHRDRFDKLFCVVIPFGKWTGGELCLYEPGFVFRLHPWDILIFPSCDVTHFNLHFEGIQLSLVLHSDKYGDQWVCDGNGWLPNDDEQ